MSPQREQDIKCVASRMRRILKETEETLMYVNFWDDLQTLIDLILEEEKGE